MHLHVLFNQSNPLLTINFSLNEEILGVNNIRMQTAIVEEHVSLDDKYSNKLNPPLPVHHSRKGVSQMIDRAQ